eukprot:c15608_g1_i1 orf=385-1272(-)
MLFALHSSQAYHTQGFSSLSRCAEQSRAEPSHQIFPFGLPFHEMALPRRLQGKVALITASTQGIGFGIAQRLGLEGASLVVSSRKQKNVDEAVEKLRTLGIDVIGIACHVSDAAQRKNLIKATVDKYGKIDILVSNAAVSPSVDPIVEISEAALDKLWEINVKAGILLVQDVVAHLSSGSSIIFISSIAGYQPGRNLVMYGVTKTALFGLTKGLAAELAPNVRVNSVAPGFVPTHFANYLTNDAEIREQIESKTLMGRLGTPGDIAGAVAFLVSDDASYITGEVLVVAGGLPSKL